MQEPAFSFFTVDPRDKASCRAVCKHLRPLIHSPTTIGYFFGTYWSPISGCTFISAARVLVMGSEFPCVLPLEIMAGNIYVGFLIAYLASQHKWLADSLKLLYVSLPKGYPCLFYLAMREPLFFTITSYQDSQCLLPDM